MGATLEGRALDAGGVRAVAVARRGLAGLGAVGLAQVLFLADLIDRGEIANLFQTRLRVELAEAGEESGIRRTGRCKSESH